MYFSNINIIAYSKSCDIKREIEFKNIQLIFLKKSSPINNMDL